MPKEPVQPHDHTRFSRGGRLTSDAITGLTTTSGDSGGGGAVPGTTDHGGLAGLSDDDHPSYVTVTGGGGETLNTVAATGASETIDLGLGNVHDFTLTAATVVLSFSGSVAGVADSVTVILRQDGTGGRFVTWPGSVSWPGGTTPVLQTAASAVDVFTLFTLDNGATWYGFHATSAAAVTFATPAIVLGTAAAAGAASTVIRSDSTVAAFDATVPTTAVAADVAATGSVAYAARRDHRHGMPSTFGSEILISDTPSTPLVFADLVQNEAQDDLVYAD